MGSTPVVPEGFTLDDVPEGFKLDEPVQPPEAPGTSAERYARGAATGAGRAALSAVNPVDYARAIYELGRLGKRLATPPVLGQPYEGAKAVEEIVQGAKDIGGYALTSPEAMGEVTGSLATGLLLPGALSKLNLSGKAASILRSSRATNVVRAVKGGEDLVPVVTAAGDRAELPVSITQGQLARRLDAADKAAGAAVGATRAELPGTVNAAEVAARLPEVGGLTEAGDVVTGARPLRRNMERTRAYWEDLATRPGTTGEIARNVLAGIKEEAQGEAARGGAYSRGRLGFPISPSATASADEAAAIRAAVLDTKGLSPADAAKVKAYEDALSESSLAKSLSDPAQLEHLRRVRGGAGNDWKASLVGRALAPAVGAGIGGLAGATVGMSPAGALLGAGVAEFMRSTPWQTLSAASKLKAIRALESGGVEAFRDVAIRAVVADVERRRLAESALRAQGEGVTTP